MNTPINLFPDLDNESSELFQVAREIMANDPYLQMTPNGDMIAARLAASHLGISPSDGDDSSESSPKRKVKSQKDTSYIISGKSGGSSETASKSTDFDSLVAMPPSDRLRIMKENFISTP